MDTNTNTDVKAVYAQPSLAATRQHQLADRRRLAWRGRRQPDDEPDQALLGSTPRMGADVWYGGVHLSTDFALPELSTCISRVFALLERPQHRHRPFLSGRLGTPMAERL